MQLAGRDVGRRFKDGFGWSLQFAGGKMSKWPSSLLSFLESCAGTEIWICGEQLLLRELPWMEMWGMATAR
jgi:hypothetical protein